MPKLIFESHRVKVQTPYVESFVLALKARIPRGYRAYEEHTRTWIVYRPHVDEARRLVKLYFGSDVEEVNAAAYDDFEEAEHVRQEAEREQVRARAQARQAAHNGLQDPKTCDPTTYPFDVLYVRPDAPRHVYEAAYKALSMAAHPDRQRAHGLTQAAAEELQKRINVAVATIRRRAGLTR